MNGTNGGLKIVNSKFAALKIENDDDEDNNERLSSSSNGKNEKWQKVVDNDKKKKSQTKANSASKPTNNSQANKQQASSVANGNGSKKGKNKNNHDDWESWKQKDEQFSENLFKDQLKQALIDSKLEFETNKATKIIETNNKTAAAKSNKPVKMSLNEFQAKNFDQKPNVTVSDAKLDVEARETEKFIDGIDDRLNELLLKEKSLAQREDVPVEKYLYLQYQDHLQKKDAEIEELKKALVTYKDEIDQVKTRNKQLAFIIANGEMKEKSELVKENMELTAVKTELTQQVSELSKSLEQEKSKVHQLENDAKKNKSKH